MTTPAPIDPALYPLFLKLKGRQVLVVGGGGIAERKVAVLLESEAVVRVVSPEATEKLRRLAAGGRIAWYSRPFSEADLDGAWFVVACTDDAATQAHVAAAAEVHRTFVLAVDDPRHASAYGGAIVRRPPFLVAISSSGESPALSRLVREIIESVLPGDEWVTRARELRARWKAERTPMSERFGALVRDFKSR